MNINPWLIALAVLGLVILFIIISMIPEMRRYLRMRRM
ncbi:MAG: DUF6893 family small protein [Chthoniobacterales bacterium]